MNAEKNEKKRERVSREKVYKD